MNETLYVHLYGGPGTGKSTTRALVFGALKQRGHNVEESPEFAKDLTWENRLKALGYQPYIFGKQTYRDERLNGEVEAVISDTSPLLSLVFRPSPLPTWWWPFKDFVISYYESRNTLNVLLQRDPSRPYNPKGRNQTEDEAKELDSKVAGILDGLNLPHAIITVDKDTNSHVDEIVGLIEKRLHV